MLEMLRFQKEMKGVGSLQNMVASLNGVINIYKKIKKKMSLCYNINYKKAAYSTNGLNFT